MTQEETPNYTSKTLFKRLWRDYLHKHRFWVALAFVIMVVDGSTLGFLSYLQQPLFDTAFTSGEQSAIYLIGLMILGLFVARGILSFLQKVILSKISLISTAEIQTDMLRQMLSFDTAFFSKNPPGELMERIQGDSAAVQQTWNILIATVGRDLFSLVFLAANAIWIDPIWALVTVIGVPVLALPTALAQRYVRRKSRTVREESAKRSTYLDEIFHGIQTVKLNAIENFQSSRFAALVDRIAGQQLKTIASQTLIPSMVDVMTGIGFFAVLALGGQEIANGEKTVGQFMSFFTAMALTFQPLRRLGAASGAWQTAAASLERVYHIFDTHPTITTRAKPTPTPAASTADIAFRDVRLSYDQKTVLQALSFEAKAGQTTALVGQSGAGKTTVFNLLTRLVDPQSGSITLGDTPIDHLDMVKLRDCFSVVSQETSLFDDSVLNNITLGYDYSPEAIENAVEAAHLQGVIDKLENGISTQVGPRGSKLSGGQRQRVAIARAILRDRPILLLDEATSALDTESERAVQAALENLAKDRTTLVIAHRLSTIRAADQIIVMHEGRALEHGSHDDLMQKNGPYAKLVNLQFNDD
ncbi:MAG: ABC transporter ATP-binding protein [Halocynthiibacter sp.]